jgi:hypothetical protein
LFPKCRSGRIVSSLQIRRPSINDKVLGRLAVSQASPRMLRVLVTLLVVLTTLVPPGMCVCQLLGTHETISFFGDPSHITLRPSAVVAACESEFCTRSCCCHGGVDVCGTGNSNPGHRGRCCPALQLVDRSQSVTQTHSLPVESASTVCVDFVNVPFTFQTLHLCAHDNRFPDLPFYLTFHTFLI